MNKRALVTVFVLIGLLTASVALADPIEGTYDCHGKSNNGRDYKGTVAIMKNGEAYNITWTIGTESYMGVGLLDGSTFSVGYAASDKSWYGVVVYKVDGKTLNGKWAMGGSGDVFTETLTRR